MSRTGFVGWSTQQLSEYAAELSALGDEDELRAVAVERAAEAFDAELCYVVLGGAVRASIGGGRDQSVVAAIEARRTSGRSSVEIAGVGVCRIAHTELAADGTSAPDGALVLCRAGQEPFGAEELALLRGMARILSITGRGVRLVSSLRDRHRLLERLGGIQRAISRRVPLREVLDEIAHAAQDVLRAEGVVLWQVHPDDPGRLHVAVSCGRGAPVAGTTAPLEGSLAGECVRAARAGGVATPVHRGAGAIAVPVSENGAVAGALVVTGAERGGRAVDVETLLALAEHATLAMNDAHTVDAMFEAHHDHVTGLPNRALFFDRGEQALATARLDRRDAAVLFIDLDGFKQVNDTLGHDAGDRLLREVGARVRATLRSGDLVARLGGDEFAVLLVRERGAVPPAEVAERVLEALRTPVDLERAVVQVRASVGVAVARSHERVAELVHDADLAMYRAKLAGKDRCVVFEPGMRGEVAAHRDLERDLRRALDGGELTLAYQPIVALDRLRLHGVEALARWEHATLGPIGPRQFVAMAEEMSVVDVIDRFALRVACRELRERIDAGRAAPDLDVFVNVSHGRLRNDSILEDVRVALDASRLDPRRLVVEFEEEALAGDPEGAARRLWRLHEMGVRIALDSFGSGSSSLAVLPRLPVEILKMDGVHLSTTLRGGRRGPVALAVAQVARAFGMQTVGEGVETAAHLDGLRRLGCTFGQGFLFSRPIADGEWRIDDVAASLDPAGPR